MSVTLEETIRMLEAKAECNKRETSGTDSICNNRECDECDLNYMQGNMKEQREALYMAISALQAQDSETKRCATCKHNPPSKKWPCVDCDMREPADRWEKQDVPVTNVGDMVSRQKAIDLAEEVETKRLKGEIDLTYAPMIKGLMQLPSAKPEIIRCRDCKKCLIDNIYHDYWCDGKKVWRDHYCGYAERKNADGN